MLQDSVLLSYLYFICIDRIYTFINTLPFNPLMYFCPSIKFIVFKKQMLQAANWPF